MKHVFKQDDNLVLKFSPSQAHKMFITPYPIHESD
jgi:hypothetical protein